MSLNHQLLLSTFLHQLSFLSSHHYYRQSPISLQAIIGQNPSHKVIYDRNLQALVDKLFPHFLQQVLL